jgi:NAD(P)-dependent dehydrogenase (short-subunit alcohol dehydrogenase family)
LTRNLKGRAARITGGVMGQGFAIAQALAAKAANQAVGSYIGALKGRSEVAVLAAFLCGGEAGPCRRKRPGHRRRPVAGIRQWRDRKTSLTQ